MFFAYTVCYSACGHKLRFFALVGLPASRAVALAKTPASRVTVFSIKRQGKMSATPKTNPKLNLEKVCRHAVTRLETELGWSSATAESALVEYAAAYGVLRHEVAAAILTAVSLKRGLGYVLSGVDFGHNSLNQSGL